MEQETNAGHSKPTARTVLIISSLLTLSTSFHAPFRNYSSRQSKFSSSRRPQPLPATVSSLFQTVAADDSRRASTSLLAITEQQPEERLESNFSWSFSWFPIAFSAYTDKHRPTQHYLLGAPIVIWYFNQTWHAMLDKCPHRLALLSEGRVIPSTGDIECPYHGFSFDGITGNCTRVPQAEEPDNISRLPGIETRGCATALPCRVQQGIIFVHSSPLYYSDNIRKNKDPVDDNDLKRYRIEPIDRPGVLHADYFRDLPMEWSTLAENVLDPSHLPFTHHKTISSRSKVTPVPLVLRRPISAQGFEADRNTQPTPGSVEFRAPHLCFSETTRGNHSFSDWNIVYAIPTLPGRCRLLVRVVFEVSTMKPPLKWIFGMVFRQPGFLLHLSNHKILEDDNIFLHHQGHNYRSLNTTFEDGTYLPTSADVVVIAFQKWLTRFKSQHDTWSPHTPPGAFIARDEVLTRNELIARGHTHTDACSSCLTAKRWLERVEPWLGVGAILCAIRAFSGGGVIRWPVGIMAGILYALKKTTRNMWNSMEVGIWPPPRNQ